MERDGSIDRANSQGYSYLFDLGLLLCRDALRSAAGGETKKGTPLILRFFFFSVLLHGLITLGLIYSSRDQKQDFAKIEIQITERLPSSVQTPSEFSRGHKALVRRTIPHKKPSLDPSYDADDGSKTAPDHEATSVSLHQAYYEEIRKKVSSRKAYPRIARMQGLQGRVLVAFLLSKEGHIIESKVESSSGHDILDRSALEAVQMAQPFPAFPESFRSKTVRMEITLVYSLED